MGGGGAGEAQVNFDLLSKLQLHFLSTCGTKLITRGKRRTQHRISVGMGLHLVCAHVDLARNLKTNSNMSSWQRAAS